MTTPALARRPTGRYGLKPRDRDRKVPYVEHYLRPWEGAPGPHPARFMSGTALEPEPLPPASGDIDRESSVPSWPMYANGPDPANPPYAPDGLGDCYWAGSAHSFAAERVYAGFAEPSFPVSSIVTGYESTGYVPGNSSTDRGTDPAQGCKFLSTTGLVDSTGAVHKLAGYAFFKDVHNQALIAQVLAACGTVGIGFNCTQNFEDAFATGQPCTYEPSSPAVGGHWVVLQRRRYGVTAVLDWVTWGAVQRVTLRYHWHQVTDVAMLVSEDYVRANGTTMQGLDLEQLCADTADAE